MKNLEGNFHNQNSSCVALINVKTWDNSRTYFCFLVNVTSMSCRLRTISDGRQLTLMVKKLSAIARLVLTDVHVPIGVYCFLKASSTIKFRGEPYQWEFSLPNNKIAEVATGWIGCLITSCVQSICWISLQNSVETWLQRNYQR